MRLDPYQRQRSIGGKSMEQTKSCQLCGKEFKKRHRDSMAQWEARVFCSVLCKNKSRKKTPAEERFWKYVPKLHEKMCWEWTGGMDGAGYGTVSNGFGKSPLKAHRLSWEIHFGAIPDGLMVCHACDNPSCVNPDHLLLGTQAANALDMSRKGRMNYTSLLNLHPGQPGKHGAGAVSNKEKFYGVCE